MNNPHFIIGGERRSGSTTLYELLKRHSEIDMYRLSDMDYFIKGELFSSKDWYIDFDTEEEWQETHSKEEYTRLFEGFDFKKKVGQKDADLLFWKKAHPRLKEYLPETKFIFVLRNPVKRAESQYWNEIRKGREEKSFNEAVKLEQSRSQESDYGKLHLNYLERGKYHESLKHFFEYIPKERVLIIILEKLLSQPKKELKRIAEFLEISVEEAENINLIHSNKEDVMVLNPKFNGTFVGQTINLWDKATNGVITRISRNKDTRASLRNVFSRFGKISLRNKNKLDDKTLNDLKEYYKQPNAELEKLLDTELSVWSK